MEKTGQTCYTDHQLQAFDVKLAATDSGWTMQNPLRLSLAQPVTTTADANYLNKLKQGSKPAVMMASIKEQAQSLMACWKVPKVLLATLWQPVRQPESAQGLHVGSCQEHKWRLGLEYSLKCNLQSPYERC